MLVILLWVAYRGQVHFHGILYCEQMIWFTVCVLKLLQRLQSESFVVAMSDAPSIFFLVSVMCQSQQLHFLSECQKFASYSQPRIENYLVLTSVPLLCNCGHRCPLDCVSRACITQSQIALASSYEKVTHEYLNTNPELGKDKKATYSNPR